jgi:hypothetical protein
MLFMVVCVQAVGSGYRLVAFRNMFQTRLLVFARTDVLPLITNVCGGFEATGVGGVGVNKVRQGVEERRERGEVSPRGSSGRGCVVSYSI